MVKVQFTIRVMSRRSSTANLATRLVTIIYLRSKPLTGSAPVLGLDVGLGALCGARMRTDSIYSP